MRSDFFKRTYFEIHNSIFGVHYSIVTQPGSGARNRHRQTVIFDDTAAEGLGTRSLTLIVIGEREKTITSTSTACLAAD